MTTATTDMVAKIIGLYEDGYTQEKIVEKLIAQKDELEEKYKKEYEIKKVELKDKAGDYKKDYKEKKDIYMMSYQDCVEKGGKVYEKEVPVCEHDGKWAVKGTERAVSFVKKSLRKGDITDAVLKM